MATMKAISGQGGVHGQRRRDVRRFVNGRDGFVHVSSAVQSLNASKIAPVSL